MKRKGLIGLIFGLITLFLGIFGIRKAKKRRRRDIPKLAKAISEDEELMDKIRKNQDALERACKDSDESTQEVLAIIEELKKRINEPEVGVDPREIDIDLPDIEVE